MPMVTNDINTLVYYCNSETVYKQTPITLVISNNFILKKHKKTYHFTSTFIIALTTVLRTSVEDLTCSRDVAIWIFENLPPSWIWSNRKWRCLICPSPKTHPRTFVISSGPTATLEADVSWLPAQGCCWVMAIWNFPKCKIGRWSSIFILLKLISMLRAQCTRSKNRN